jgi:hypothetical protein
MTRTNGSRLITPVIVTLAGSIVAGAIAVGHTWGDALVAEIVTLVLAVGYYLVTRSNSDLGAIYGHRADERQREVLLRATRLAFTVMLGAAFLCTVISVALGDNYWQADLIGSLGGVVYIVGMVGYGAHETNGAVVERGIAASSVPPVDERDLDSPEND